ncbi:MAG: malto-oligosyltrehalose synthase, partial [Chloroflexi bacterium]|nr:malto-oligosyltrehalose synthase [Chloroflexota bacterium]
SEVDDLEDWVAMETASVIHSLTYLPSYRSQDDDEIIARRREQVIVRWRLLGLFDKSEAFRTVLQTTLEEINGNPDDPTSYDTLDDLLNDQPFRLAYWRVATDEINYRRFFDINDMAAIRIEDPQVFADVHRLSLQLLATGKVNGLRIDHPDGLWDPETYFWRLQAAYLEAAVKHHLGDDHEIPAEVTARLRFLRKSQPERAEWPLYVLVEKILSETEPLPFSWAVHGTTGYDFMYTVNNLFVNITNQGAFDEIYADFIGEAMDFHELTAYTQHLVMSQSLTSEIDARSTELARIVEQNRRYRGFTQNSLAFGLGEVISALNIYRTYITGPARVSERDRQYVQEAVDEAKRRNRLVPSSIFDFLRDTLLMQNFEDFAKEHRANLREFVMKFQQITGPVMAKSVEDTAFYIYNRLVSLNEVGGHPDRFGITVDEFHEHNTQKAYPHTMLSTSTHDTKRSEDVRARLNVLSDMPDEWHEAVQHWASLNADAKTTVSDEDAPSANDEYLIYQTLLGAYDHNAADAPDTFLQRIVGYMHKAINEAKTHSNWINPNNEYDQAIADFETTIWSSDAFREAFDPFYQRVAFFGRFNSLAQVLLKLTSPGVPDIYQGNELWDYSLVDPDNRRPVDFDRRQTLLNDMQSVAEADRLGFAHSLVEDMPSGAIKLYVIYRTLAYRRAHQVLFESGKYIPVKVEGPQSAHVCAFIRKDEHATALVMVPRLIVTLTQGREMPPVGEDIWQGTQIVLPESLVIDRFENILTGEQVTVGQEGLRRVIPLAQALSVFPVGFLNGLATE